MTVVAVAILIVGSIATVVYVKASLKKHTLPVFLFGLFVLLICFLGIFLQHTFFAVPYPQNRTALFLIPIAMYTLVVALISWPGSQRLATIFGVLLCLPIVAHQLRSINFNYVLDWKSSASAKSMFYTAMAQMPKPSPERPISLYTVSFESAQPTEYYRYRATFNHLALEPIRCTTPLQFSDFYLIEATDRRSIDEAHWTLLQYDSVTGSSLYSDN